MNKKQIESLRKLKDGWDSYGGIATTERAIQTALQFNVFTAVPTNDGGIQLEGFVDREEYLEIQISPEGKITSFFLHEENSDKVIIEWNRK